MPLKPVRHGRQTGQSRAPAEREQQGLGLVVLVMRGEDEGEAALPRPEIQITPKAEEAARLGVSVQQIASVLTSLYLCLAGIAQQIIPDRSVNRVT